MPGDQRPRQSQCRYLGGARGVDKPARASAKGALQMEGERECRGINADRRARRIRPEELLPLLLIALAGQAGHRRPLHLPLPARSVTGARFFPSPGKCGWSGTPRKFMTATCPASSPA